MLGLPTSNTVCVIVLRIAVLLLVPRRERLLQNFKAAFQVLGFACSPVQSPVAWTPERMQ